MPKNKSYIDWKELHFVKIISIYKNLWIGIWILKKLVYKLRYIYAQT